MPYARRDASGRIDALFAAPTADAAEEVAADDPEVAAFVGSDSDGTAPDWVRSDLALSRVIEDLVDVLVDKGVIGFTDLPIEAQQKLVTRRGRRAELDYVARLFPIDEDEDILI